LDEELKRIFDRHVDGEIGDEDLSAAIDELNEHRIGPLPVSWNERP
jgi:CBS domain-containing protein